MFFSFFFSFYTNSAKKIRTSNKFFNKAKTTTPQNGSEMPSWRISRYRYYMYTHTIGTSYHNVDDALSDGWVPLPVQIDARQFPVTWRINRWHGPVSVLLPMMAIDYI
jgi:hypothetical protein